MNLSKTVTAIGLILLIMICAILCLDKLSGNLRLSDLTEENVYTLSDGTERILSGMNQPVKLRLFYSTAAARKGVEQMRMWNNYHKYVKDLLLEYERKSKGMVKLELVDPRQYTVAEEEAEKYGLKRFQLSQHESFIFGLVATTEFGKSKVIEFFSRDRQEFVEYDVSKLISDLLQRQKSKVGVISSLPVLGSDMSPYMMQMMQMQGKRPEKAWFIAEDLKQSYTVEKVEIKDEPKIDSDVDFLLVIHPKNLDEKTLYAIDQYVMGGGKLMVFVDPHCLRDQPKRDPRNPYAGMNHKADSSLNKLLEKWGVSMVEGKITVDRTLAQSAQLAPNQPPSVLYPWLRFQDANFSKESVITAKLHNMQMLFAGVLKKTANAESEVIPLVETSAVGSSWKPESPFDLQRPDPAKIRKATLDGSKPVMVACIIRGKMETNYPQGIEIEVDAPHEHKEGEKHDEEKEAKKKERTKPVKDAAKGASVIVVADVDCISNEFAYRNQFFGVMRQGDNAPFLFNVLDFLAGSEDLIRIRTRGRVLRPFTRVDKIEKEAAKATADEEDAIKKKIKDFNDQLQKLGMNSDGKAATVIESEALQKKRKLEADIREANRQLRRLQADQRDKTEALKARLQFINMGAAPLVVLVIAIALGLVRFLKAKQYSMRRD